MRVVFLQDVPNVAKAGDVREVADGYARNYLFPKKLALQLKAGAVNQVETQQLVKARQSGEVAALAQNLEGREVNLKARAGEQDRLFGAITSTDVAAELAVMGFTVDKRKIEMAEPFHHLGTYEVTLKLARDITPRIKVVIVQDVTVAAAEEKPPKEKKKATKKEEKAPAETADTEAVKPVEGETAAPATEVAPEEKKKRAPRAKKPAQEAPTEAKTEKETKKAAKTEEGKA
jgi:large subunit ribosomal protein L9